MIRETLRVSDYQRIQTIQSKIDPLKTTETVTGMLCPHCKTRYGVIRHNQSITCSCGLKMTCRGNALNCEFEPVSSMSKFEKEVLSMLHKLT